MTAWTARCWMGTSSGYQNIVVYASTRNGAYDQLEKIYRAQQIINLRPL